MKKSLVLFVSFLGFLGACTEVPPPINFGFNEGEISYDTSLISEENIPAAQAKNVYIEDITGVKCVNCPRAAESIKAIRSQYAGRVVSLGLYTKGFLSLTFPDSADTDLRTDEASEIHNNLFDNSPLPGGGISRRSFPSEKGIRTNYLKWSSYASEILEEKSPVSLKVTAEKSDDVYLLTIETIFTEDVEDQLYISTSWLESGIVTKQKTPDSTSYFYVHDHVLRKMYTPFIGTLWHRGAKVRGLSVKKVYAIKPPENVDESKSYIAVALNYNSTNNKEVVQCVEVKL